jgi:hypothetical protein
MSTRKKKAFYEDQYASVSVVESVPCVKVKLSGFPRGSDHYQYVQSKLLEAVRKTANVFCRLHLLTDNTEAGLVLDEDMVYFKSNIIPAMEEAGIRYHAIVLPQNFFGKVIRSQTALSNRKLKVAYFDSVIRASKWLKKQ